MRVANARDRTPGTWMPLLIALIVPTAAHALVHPPPVTVEPTGALMLPVQPGERTTLAFTVRNVTPTLLPSARVGGYMSTSDEALAGYNFVPDTPACHTPYFDPGWRHFAFDIPVPIEPGEAIECRYTVERSADARHDLEFALCPNVGQFCATAVAIGTLPQMRIHVEQPDPVPAGSRSVLVRLRVENLSDWTIPRRDVSTECREFLGGQVPAGPFRIRNDFEGACETGASHGCLNFGGQSYFDYGFAFGPFDPGESHSCLLRLEFFEPASSQLAVSIFFTDPRVIREDGAIGIGGPGTYVGRQRLGIHVTPAPAPVQVPVGLAGLLVLVVMLTATGLALRAMGPCSSSQGQRA